MTFLFCWYDTSTITSDAHVAMLNMMRPQEKWQPCEHQSKNIGLYELIWLGRKICNSMLDEYELNNQMSTILPPLYFVLTIGFHCSINSHFLVIKAKITLYRMTLGTHLMPTKCQFPATARDCFSVIVPLPLRRVLSRAMAWYCRASQFMRGRVWGNVIARWNIKSQYSCYHVWYCTVTEDCELCAKCISSRLH